MAMPSEKGGRPHPRGWPLQNYMALFVAALLALIAVRAVAVLSLTEQQARQSAQVGAIRAARATAFQVADDLGQLEQTTAELAANPQVAGRLASPMGLCSLTFPHSSLFSTGHLDLVKSDGSVRCSSEPLPDSPVYSAAAWLPAAIQGPVTAAPFLDPTTGQISAVVAAPVPGGLGTVAAIVALAPLGPNLAAAAGGGRELEFLITTKDTKTVLARSLEPARWVGSTLAGTAFARSADQAERQDVEGTPRLYGSFAVASTGWRVFAGSDVNAALAGADQSANHILAINLAGLGIMLVVVFLLYRRIVDPVRRLSLVMRGTTSGAAVDAVAGTGAREVTDLAEDFDQLMSSFKGELAVRLDSEHAALVSERNYRTLFESHPQPMWVYDVHTLAFLSVNDAAVEHYGYSSEDFMSMTFKDIRPTQDVPKFLELLAHPTPTIDRTGPWRLQLKDGSYVQVLLTSHAVTFDGHDARVVLAEDLTESQRLEMDLLQSQARVEANAELSRAKAEMVSMVSHEMRTPLASMVGFAELLVTREVTPERQKEYLAVMLQEGLRLTALINDFLDLRRIEGGHPTMRFAPADVGALIKRVADVASRGTDLAIETDLPEDLPLVRADSDSIFRVMSNLFTNARNYSPNGGSIVVSARVLDGMVEISVKDEGLGIPAAALPRIFDKFYRVDNPDRSAIRGTGLGLAICKNIVEAHGGRIGASSAGLGKGSTFHFTLPMVRVQAQTGDVLIVEDDSGFAYLLEAELLARGVSSVWAADAETADQLMTDKTPRAVVLDLLLPGLQGDAFLLRLRAIHGVAIPVVVVTLKDLDLEEGLILQKAGVTAILRKGPGMAESAADLIVRALSLELVAT